MEVTRGDTGETIRREEGGAGEREGVGERGYADCKRERESSRRAVSKINK